MCYKKGKKTITETVQNQLICYYLLIIFIASIKCLENLKNKISGFLDNKSLPLYFFHFSKRDLMNFYLLYVKNLFAK